jgi:hypothetical protein
MTIMLIEQRSYDLVAGKVPDFYALYQSEGLEVQLRHLGRLLGYYHSEFGSLNQVVHLWGYADLEDRARRRAALFADEKWRAYFDKVITLILRQESRILVPAPFAAHDGPSCLWRARGSLAG